MNLTIKQTKALDILEDKKTTELVFGGGAGGGKSIIGVYWLTKCCLKYPGTRWVMGRSKLKTLKETTLNSFFEVCRMQGLKADVHYKYNGQSGTIHFLNGSEIILKDLFLYPSDPHFDSLGSLEITGAFVDECNQIVHKAWNVLKSRIRYKLKENNLIPKIFGSCNPSKGWVFQEFYKPQENGNIRDGRKFVQSLVTDNPHISPHYIDSLRTLDKVSQERLLKGNWHYDDSADALIEYDAMHDYFSNDFVPEGQIFITADIARKGKDKTVIRVWSGFRVIHREALRKAEITESAMTIRNLATGYGIPMSNVVVDEDGVGGGVKDILKCKGFVNNSSAVEVQGKKENYANLKAQCSFRMAKRINNRELYEVCEDADLRTTIIEEMEQVRQKDIDKDGKLNVIPKDEIKNLLGRSPDEWDSIMMREYFEVVKKEISAFA